MFVIATGLAFFLASVVAASASDVAQQDYAALVARVRRNDFSVDFAKLRMAYAQSSAYKPYDEKLTLLRREMQRDEDNGNDAAVTALADRVLAQDFVDIEAHEILGRQTGSQAAFHRIVAAKLVQSILRSGNGKTPETAYLVISIDEEYALLDGLGLQALMQSFLEHRGHYYDVLMATDGESAPQVIYFDIGLPFDTLNGRGQE